MTRMDSTALAALVVRAIEDIKGRDVVSIDVHELTDVMDIMVVASGTSSRHVKSIASNVVDAARDAGERTIGTEGVDAGEWILVDFGGVVVHVMSEEARRFYAIEKRWSEVPVR